jgi:hypothetical protein
MVVRHYAFALIFITPLTICLAEGTHLGRDAPNSVIKARSIDTMIGSIIGLLGGAVLHNAAVRLCLRLRLNAHQRFTNCWRCSG